MLNNKNEQDANYVCIPGGTYIYSDNGQEVSIEDLHVARYPVTNRQYRSFIDYLAGNPSPVASVLPVEEYEEALRTFAADNPDDAKGMQNYLQSEKDLAKLFSSEYDGDRKFNKDEQPVVGVSWYAARAYCLWLSMLDPEGWSYMLPTEQQWALAAGGTERRPFPWGGESPTLKHANYDFNVEATTPVGSYPDGATPEGLYDMAGNVWEWMENWYNSDYAIVAIRGGAWDSWDRYNASKKMLCSARDFSGPQIRHDDVGFRVVRSRPH